MFKFMKSKKGFTLVELMIVVVIMAILVAVAVPIFSAVTKNARIKTCAANRREIVSQLNGWAMGQVDGKTHTYKDATALEFKIWTDKSGNGQVTVLTEDTFIPLSTFQGLFQKVPACPSSASAATATADNTDGGVITVTISKPVTQDGVDQTANITAVCNGGEDGTGVHA